MRGMDRPVSHACRRHAAGCPMQHAATVEHVACAGAPRPALWPAVACCGPHLGVRLLSGTWKGCKLFSAASGASYQPPVRGRLRAVSQCQAPPAPVAQQQPLPTLPSLPPSSTHQRRCCSGRPAAAGPPAAGRRRAVARARPCCSGALGCCCRVPAAPGRAGGNENGVERLRLANQFGVAFRWGVAVNVARRL